MSQDSEVFESVQESIRHERETGVFKPPADETAGRTNIPTPRRPERQKTDTKRRKPTRHFH